MILWLFQNKLLRQDPLPNEWCPWHMNFYCPKCGEVWLRRIHAEGEHAYVFKPCPCPWCERPVDYWGLPANIINGYEQSNGYRPLELLALEFLSTTGGFNSAVYQDR